MSQKSTNNLESEAIDKAKRCTESDQTSASNLVDEFFSKSIENPTDGFSSITHSLVGIAKNHDSHHCYKELLSKYRGIDDISFNNINFTSTRQDE
jgi:hypothetical protein